MNRCRQVKRDIRNGDADKWSAHIVECEDCRLFSENIPLMNYGRNKTDESAFLPLEDVFTKIQEETQSRSLRSQLPQLNSGWRFGFGLLVTAVTLMSVFLVVKRVDWFVYPRFRLMTEVAALFGAVVVFMWLAMRPLYQPRFAKWKRYSLSLVVMLLVLSPFWLPVAHGEHPESLKGIGDDVFMQSLSCFCWGTAIGTAVFITIKFFVRGGKKAKGTFDPALWGAGFLALLSLHLHCPIVHPLHIALGHMSIIIGVSVAILIRRYL